MQSIKKEQTDTVKQLKELAPKTDGGEDGHKGEGGAAAAQQSAMDAF